MGKLTSLELNALPTPLFPAARACPLEARGGLAPPAARPPLESVEGPGGAGDPLRCSPFPHPRLPADCLPQRILLTVYSEHSFQVRRC